MFKKNFLCSAILATAIHMPTELAAVKFSSAAKYKVLPSKDTNNVVIEGKIYREDPGCIYSEFVKALPESLIPFEYKGVILNYTPADALYAGVELMSTEIIEKALELLGKENKQVDIDAYINTVERTLKMRLNKLNFLLSTSIAMVGAMAFCSCALCFSAAGATEAELGEIGNWRSVRLGCNLARITVATSCGITWPGVLFFWHNKKQVKANAAQMTKALLSYPNHAIKNVEKTRSSVANIANLTGDELIELLAEQIV